MSETSPTPAEAAFFRTIRSWGIVRTEDGILGGVIAGLGWRINLAPWPSRLLVALASVVLGPIMLVLYALGWALLPDAKGNIVIQNFGRGVTQLGPLIGIAIFTALGLLLLPHLGPGSFLRSGQDWIDLGAIPRVIIGLLAVLIPLAMVGAVVTLIVYLVHRQRQATGAADVAGDGAPASTSTPAPVYALTPVEAREAMAAATATSAATAMPGTPSMAQSGDDLHEPTSSLPKPPPPAPLPQPRPQRPRVPGPGRPFYLLGLAWLFLSVAGTAWAWREGMLGIWAPLAWGLVFITGWGVLLMLVSLAGRRQGFQGFVGTVGLMITVIVLWQSPLLIDHYSGERDIWASEPDYVSVDGTGYTFDGEYLDGEYPPDGWEPDAPWDPTSAFSTDYESVVLGAYCYESTVEDLSSYGLDTTSRFTLATLTDDRAIDVATALTTISVPRGTSLHVNLGQWISAVVVFPDRGVTCDLPSTEELTTERLQLTNADAPLVTVDASNDFYTTPVIVIEEN